MLLVKSNDVNWIFIGYSRMRIFIQSFHSKHSSHAKRVFTLNLILATNH